jgi:hypothetical protein
MVSPGAVLHGWARTLFAAVCLALSGCGPSDPLEIKVEGTNQLDHSMWKMKASERLSPEQVADFDEALQEIKFQIMSEGKASGGEAITAAALGKISDLSVREVLGMGLGRKLQRLQDEQDVRLKTIQYNSGIATRPGDTRSQEYLEEVHDRQVQQLRDEVIEIQRVKGRLAAAGIPAVDPTPGSAVAGGPATPSPASPSPKSAH